MYMHRAVLQPQPGCYCSVGIRFTHGVLDSPCTFYIPSSAGARNLTHENEPQSNSTAISIKPIAAGPGLEASPGSTFCRWRLRVRRSCARLVRFSDEAANKVARDELLAVQLEPRRGRGVVGLEPLLDGAALVRVAIYLFVFATGRG